MEWIITLVILILFAGLTMAGTEILYTVSAAVIPILALVMVVVGCIMGLFVAVKNTVSVYWEIYVRRGK